MQRRKFFRSVAFGELSGALTPVVKAVPPAVSDQKIRQ